MVLPAAYVDSSAIAKLLIPEPERDALVDELSTTTMRFTGDIALVEVARAAMRAGVAMADVDHVLGQFATVAVGVDVISIARTLEPATLRTLDAIHLASALSLRVEGLTFVAYDTRLLHAAGAAGLAIASPGA